MTEAPQSQTLDRGLRILEPLAAAGSAQSVMDIAQAVGLHRSIAYRLLRTLEDHQLVERDAGGRYGLGLGLAALARGGRAAARRAPRGGGAPPPAPPPPPRGTPWGRGGRRGPLPPPPRGGGPPPPP